MQRGKNSCETIFAVQLLCNTLAGGGCFKMGITSPLSGVGGDAIWEALEETLWAKVNCKSNMPRDSGKVYFVFARHSEV